MQVPGAVFARNHLGYLEAAVAAAASNPEGVVTFRSQKEWVGALRILEERGPGVPPVYFGVVGGGPEVRFKAWLREVVLEPRSSDDHVQRLLGSVAKPTADEGLWEEGAGSLYAVSGCYQLDVPFPITKLVKSSDGEPLSIDYKYSYSLVQDLSPEILGAPLVATDIEAPAPRIEARHTRIVRDTAVVRRLKALHNHTCQICGTRLEIDPETPYSEGHHLQPLGRPHDGPDKASNLLVVCPNCHALLDMAGPILEHNSLTRHPDHEVGAAYLAYHNRLVEQRRAN